MFVVNKFCFFLSLYTGTLIIGVLNLVYGLLHIVLEIETALAFHRLRFEDDEHKYSGAVKAVYSENSVPSIQFLFGAYLIYGTIKAKPTFLFANVIVQLAINAYASTYVIFAVLFLIVEDRELANTEQIINEIIKIPVMLYFATVIYSHYEAIMTQSTPIDPLNRRRDTADGDEITLTL